MRSIRIELNRLAFIVLLDNDVSNSPKKLFTLRVFRGSQELLLVRPDSVPRFYKLPVEIRVFPFLELVVYRNQLGAKLITMSNQVIKLFVFFNLLLSGIA